MSYGAVLKNLGKRLRFHHWNNPSPFIIPFRLRINRNVIDIYFSLHHFIESGFAKALIQKQNRTEIDFSTTFLFNLGSAIIIYWLFYLIAPWIALFYEAPQLSPLLRVLSLNIIIGSLNIVQRAKLMISMDFKTLAKVNFGEPS